MPTLTLEEETTAPQTEIDHPRRELKFEKSDLREPLFLSENEFRVLLVRERKRSDRTKSPLLLALIDLSVLLDRAMSNRLMHEKIKQGLEACSRDIDLRGWYREHREIGILYNDIRLDAVDGIMAKLEQCVWNVFGEHLARAITLRHVVYPLDVAANPLVSAIERSMLYPDQPLTAPTTRFQRALKRATDIAVSLAALMALAPVFAVIAALIKRSSPGPVFYSQERLGYGGKRFRLYKFRSMKPECETGSHKAFVLGLITGTARGAGDTGFFKIENDPRVTGIGRFLRKTSLDELPQLWNVLKGDMSLVGPRPPIPYEVEAYAPWHRRRILEAIPGITGPWQVEGRSRTSFDDMVRMDLRYSAAWSLWLDIKLLFKTPLAVFIGKGAC